jgi:hypothetical protein
MDIMKSPVLCGLEVSVANWVLLTVGVKVLGACLGLSILFSSESEKEVAVGVLTLEQRVWTGRGRRLWSSMCFTVHVCNYNVFMLWLMGCSGLIVSKFILALQ